MRASYKVALGGICMALSLLVMSATAIIPVASFAFPALAGALLIPINLRLGKKWGLLVYLGVSLLSFFISPDHTATISFLVLFGYYPSLKSVIERLKSRVLEWILKMLLFNASIAVGAGLSVLLFGIEYLMGEYAEFTTPFLIGFIAACNVVFVIFDVALTRVITAMIYKLMPLFDKIK